MMARDFASPPRQIEASASLQEAAKLMDRWHVGSLVVSDEGESVGMISDRDVALAALGGQNEEGYQSAVRKSMHAPLYRAAEDVTVAHACRLMRDHGVRRLALIDSAGQVTGVVGADDLLQTMGAQLGALTKAVGRELRAEAADQQPGSSVYGSE